MGSRTTQMTVRNIRLLAICGLFALLGLSSAPPARAQTPPEIVELARALKGDPDLIYEYVFNNIQTLPMHGSLKGALGALLDRQGTAFDQAELMVLLLRQSGLTANFVVGSIHLSGAQVANWLGTDTGEHSIRRVFFTGGFTYGYSLLPNGDIDDIHFNWAWVQAAIPGSACGSNCIFDPATKLLSGDSQYTRVPGIGFSTLASAMGYDQSSFLSNAAAVTTSSPWALTSLNRNGVRQNLTSYATSLVAYLRANSPSATTADVIGGLTNIAALPVGTSYRWTTLPHQFSSTVTVYSNIPSTYRVTLTQQFGWNDANGAFTSLSSPITFNTGDIYGHRMTVAFSGSSVPSLLFNGVQQMSASGAPPTGTQLTVRVTISFPWPAALDGYPGVVNNDDTRMPTAPNSIQALTTSWGPASRGIIERHRRLLQQNLAAYPDNPQAEPVLGESLSIFGYTYAAEYAQNSILIGRLSGTLVMNYFYYGAFGLSTHGGVTGPYISIWIRGQNYVQSAGRSSTTSYTASEGNAFFAEGLAGSVIESATLEQTQPGISAVSTTKLIDIAVQNGVRIFDINNNAISGDSAAYYTSTIRPLLSAASWSNPGDLTAVDNNVAVGDRIIAPENGALSLSLYTGTGWYRIKQNSGADLIGGSISGNLSGGQSADPVTPAETNTNTETSVTPPSNSDVISLPVESQGDAGGLFNVTPWSAEPVNLATGDYFLSATDLTSGGADVPMGLALQRYYDSGTRLANSAMGYGWTHGFALTALPNSDPFEGLGASSPINGAAAIVATLVAIDIGNTGSPGARPLDRFVVASVIYRWLTDNLTANVVAVKQPGYVEHFAKLADGSYNPPPGSASLLALDGSIYTYLTRDKAKLIFNSDGNLASWTSAAGASMTLVYATSPQTLSSVTNNFGRSLAFEYQAGLLTQVTDDSGRRVSYAYDSAGNLVIFTDALGQVTTYAYSLPGQLTQIFYPWTFGYPFVTNVYDALGRVKTQTNVNGAAWQYFLTGTRSEEIDPLGVRHVLYLTSRGKTQIEFQDFGGPLETKTTNAFDGLDRLTLSTAPEGNSTAYTYDLNSNVLTLTRNPKPSSPLSPLVTTTQYHATFNKPVRITDPRGLVTANEYDPWTGNLLSVTADADNLQARTRYTYNGVGQVLTVTDPIGTLTRNVYDGFGNLTSVVADAGPDRLNLTTTSTFDARGDPVTVTDARGNVTTNTYDLARRRLSTTTPPPADAPAGLVTRYSYDPAGKVVQTQQSANGSLLRTTSATYTRAGKSETTTDANGNTTSFAYDPLDRLVTNTDPMGRITRYAYDRLGRRISATNLAIQATPLAQQTFTLNGQRASLTDANTNTTEFAYDGLDRLSTTTYPGGSTDVVTYDASSNVVTRKTRAGGTPIAYAYDTLNRLVTKTPPSPWPAVTYSYDLAGRQTGVSDTSPAIASAVPPGGSTVAYTTAYAYDPLNRPTGVTWSPAPAATSPAAGPVVTFGHAYNKANQRTGESSTDATWLGYPAPVDSNTAYTANNLNQYTAVGAISPTYDGNGNLTFDGAYTLEHDAENRLVSATDGTTGSAYAFDGRGRRKLKAVGETSLTISVTDADNREVLEYEGLTGMVLRWYAYGLGPNAVLNQMNVGANTRDTLIPNLLGSIAGSYDSTGALTKFGYQPYGSGAAAPQFAYTGQRIDPETGGLYYYRARHYSTVFGRFLQTDPLTNGAEANSYAYAENDPVNLLDPLGLNAEGAGSSFGQSLFQSSVNTLVPGAYYSGLAQQELQAGNYGSAAVYGAASLADATLGILTLGQSTRAVSALRTATASVALYEVGSANALRARSVVGDRLEIHHAVQTHPAAQVIPSYDRLTAPAIAIPSREHRVLPNMTGPYSGSPRDLLARDIRNLRNYTEAPNSALQELIKLNKSQYPEFFVR